MSQKAKCLIQGHTHFLSLFFRETCCVPLLLSILCTDSVAGSWGKCRPHEEDSFSSGRNLLSWAGLPCRTQSVGLLYSPAFLEVSDNPAFRGGHESSRCMVAPEAWAWRALSWGRQLSSVSFVSPQNDIPCIFVQGFFGEAEGGEAHWVKRPGWGW